jgi:hypothetical protein
MELLASLLRTGHEDADCIVGFPCCRWEEKNKGGGGWQIEWGLCMGKNLGWGWPMSKYGVGMAFKQGPS